MRVGILTGGGDCPGLNAVIRAAVRKGIFHYKDEFVGFLEGWRGVVENQTRPLDAAGVSGILHLGGTILRTSRTNPRKMEGGINKWLSLLREIAEIRGFGIGDRIKSLSCKIRPWGRTGWPYRTVSNSN